MRHISVDRISDRIYLTFPGLRPRTHQRFSCMEAPQKDSDDVEELSLTEAELLDLFREMSVITVTLANSSDHNLNYFIQKPFEYV